MDPRQYLGVVRRWLPFAVVGAVIGGIAAVMLLGAQPRVYESEATLKLGQPLTGAPILLTSVSDRLLTEYAYRGTSSGTLDEVSSALELGESATDLQRRVSSQAEPGSSLLTITARANSPEGAAALADMVGERLIATNITAQGESSVQQALLDDLDALRQCEA